MLQLFFGFGGLCLIATAVLVWPALAAQRSGGATAELTLDSSDKPSLKIQLIMVCILVCVAAGIYNIIGTPNAVDFKHLPIARTRPAGHPETPSNAAVDMSLGAAAQRLAAKLESESNDPDGWALLIKTYESLGWTGAAEQARQKAAAVDPGRFAGEGPSENPIASARAAMADKDFSRATGILRSALAATPRDANLLVELADATVATNGFSFSSEANQLLSDALALNPNHPKALWLAGTAAYRAGDLDTAATHWQRFLKVVPPQSEEARIVAGNLREIGAAAPTAIPTSQTAPTTATATGSRVDGSVTLSAELMHRAGADATVFVFARSADGMPLPLAVRKYRVADLPLTFSLDDSMAMAAGRNLSSADTVVIGARISTSGNAIAQPGDLEGVSEPVEVAAAHDLNIVINREIQ